MTVALLAIAILSSLRFEVRTCPSPYVVVFLSRLAKPNKSINCIMLEKQPFGIAHFLIKNCGFLCSKSLSKAQINSNNPTDEDKNIHTNDAV